MTAPNRAQQALEAIADALKRLQKSIITCHLKPDADSLGSMIAVHGALEQLGQDSVMYLASAEPLAPEWKFLPRLDEMKRAELPPDYAERALICLDCGNSERLGNDELVKAALQIINIDHHGDNTRFGEINLVIPGASSTAEIIYYILRMMDVEITNAMAEAIYTGILVDSGRFQYSTATASTFRVAADLIAGGLDHTAIFRSVYEHVPLSKSRLSCRMLDNMTLACDGRLAIGVLDRKDFEETGAGAEFTEGLVDTLRALEGVVVAALLYARLDGDGQPYYRVSLRSSTDRLNVQRIAKLKGGGGHPQAAGLSVEGETAAQITDFLIEAVGDALGRAGLESCSREGNKI